MTELFAFRFLLRSSELAETQFRCLAATLPPAGCPRRLCKSRRKMLQAHSHNIAYSNMGVLLRCDPLGFVGESAVNSSWGGECVTSYLRGRKSA